MKKIITLVMAVCFAAFMATGVYAGGGDFRNNQNNGIISDSNVNSPVTNNIDGGIGAESSATSSAESNSVGVGIGEGGQGGQGGAGGNAEGGNANIEAGDVSNSNNITFEGSETKREMPNAVLPNFPQGPVYFGNAPMTEEFMSIEDLAKLNAEWSRVSIESWAGRNDDDMENVEYTERIVRSYYDPSDKLKVSFVEPNNESREFIGIIKAKANKNVDMEAVISVLFENAINNGANLMIPINQGAKRVLSASSIGIALGYSHVVIGGGSERTAGAGTAGIGWSNGESGHRHEPFLRVALYRIENDDIYKNIPTFVNESK